MGAKHSNRTVRHRVHEGEMVGRGLEQSAARCEERHVGRHVQKVAVAFFSRRDVTATPAVRCTNAIKAKDSKRWRQQDNSQKTYIH